MFLIFHSFIFWLLFWIFVFFRTTFLHVLGKFCLQAHFEWRLYLQFLTFSPILSSGFVILWLLLTCRIFQTLVLKWCLELFAPYWYWGIAHWVLDSLDCLLESWEWVCPPLTQLSLAPYLPTKPLHEAGVPCPSVCLKPRVLQYPHSGRSTFGSI